MKRYGRPKGARRDYWRRLSHSLAVFREAAGEDLHTIITNQVGLHKRIAELQIAALDLKRQLHDHNVATMAEFSRITRSDGIFL